MHRWLSLFLLFAVDQVFKTYGKDAYSAIYMVINTILCLAHWYSREEGESRYKLAFLNLVGLAGSGKTRSCILSSRMLGIRNNNVSKYSINVDRPKGYQNY